MTEHAIEAKFTVSAEMRQRSKRIDDRVVKMLAEHIGGDEVLARAIYRAALALPHIIKKAVTDEQEENRAAG